MSERYTRYSTANDVMKEFLIYGAELTDLGFPRLPAVQTTPSETVDFTESLSRRLRGHKQLNVNWYIDDEKFLRVWNAPDRYTDHLKCFESVCGLDFSINTQMPLVMQMWNKYRSMALDWYLTLNGITVIPNVNIIPYEGREWLLDGLPRHSTVCCSTNGRVRTKWAREEFCQGFYEMCERLEPTRVVVVGILPDELNSPVEIVNFKSRNQKVNENFGG
jgi:hypothetical protein